LFGFIIWQLVVAELTKASQHREGGVVDITCRARLPELDDQLLDHGVSEVSDHLLVKVLFPADIADSLRVDDQCDLSVELKVAVRLTIHPACRAGHTGTKKVQDVCLKHLASASAGVEHSRLDAGIFHRVEQVRQEGADQSSQAKIAGLGLGRSLSDLCTNLYLVLATPLLDCSIDCIPLGAVGRLDEGPESNVSDLVVDVDQYLFAVPARGTDLEAVIVTLTTEKAVMPGRITEADRRPVVDDCAVGARRARGNLNANLGVLGDRTSVCREARLHGAEGFDSSTRPFVHIRGRGRVSLPGVVVHGLLPFGVAVE
jgi:hypothetical protein